MASGPINNGDWNTPPQIWGGAWGQMANGAVESIIEDMHAALPDASPDFSVITSHSNDPKNITSVQLKKFLASETVTIYVGPGREEFKLSRDLLCYVSPFFKAAFEGEFKEGHEQTMELLEDDPEAFNHVVSYIYRGNFGSLTGSCEPHAGCFRTSSKLSTSIYLLEFSERLQVSGMKKAALTDLGWLLRYRDTLEPTIEDVELAFNMLPADSKGIEAIVEYVADDFLKTGLKLSIDLIKTWKFEPLLSTIEGFDMLFIFAMKRLAVERLEEKHGHHHSNCLQGWAGCPTPWAANASWLRQGPHY